MGSFGALRIRLVLLGTMLAAGGCDVDPFCIDCVDEAPVDAGAGDTGAGDAGPRDAGPADAGPSDAGPDGCVEGAREVCNGRDDDCDGEVDEDFDLDTDLDHCGACGVACVPPHAFGECVGGECGVASCDVGYYDLDGDPDNGCEYRCLPTEDDDSLCDLRDNDCDGEVDEDIDLDTDPDNCGMCGTACRFPHATGVCVDGSCEIGTCDTGYHDLDGVESNGCEHACTPADPPVEVCNGRDDDCDGVVDDGDPGGGAACGTGVGACVEGVEHCVDGAVVCVGAVGPAAEVCNGVDDDCDGELDEEDPAAGTPCGTDVGECAPGIRTCSGGTLVCAGATGPTAELCNGLDDDCDGAIDDGNPGGGASCGSSTGACSSGTETCLGGSLQCVGATGPTVETCNGVDDDCDGADDEDFDLTSDARNCGACERECAFLHATAACADSDCVLVACDTGWVDLDGDPATGCEYACDYAGTDVCNGRDDDCDGLVDEELTPPSSFCNPNGVCAGTTPTCDGAAGWTCTYPSAYEETETTCDGLDNDCDGAVDEAHPAVGTSCSNGIGACRRSGVMECNAAGDGLRCNAPAAGVPDAEICNGIDDDCDGVVDEPRDAPGPDPRYVVESMVPIGGGTWIYAYEASRPDANGSSQGTSSTRSCSRAGVLPWTNLTAVDAEVACGNAGMRLCTEAEWQAACEAASGSCGWSYASSCSSYQPDTCNGNDYDPIAGAPDDDVLLATGAMPMCYADWGAAGRVYDMSGNVKEWTAPRGAGVNPFRGGSYNNTQNGIRCDFDFSLANDSFRFPNVGFRCCSDVAP